MDIKNKSITSRDEDFAQWYTDVCKKAELMDYSEVKGFIIYRPYGYAIWEQIQNRFLLAAGSSYTAGDTGGEATHTLTVAEMPKHTHGSIYTGSSGTKNLPWLSGTGSNLAYVEGYAGGGKAHNNMPPYLVVYVWKRTA